MTHETFEKLLAQRLEKIKATLASKATEYATLDRLHNFSRAADITGETAAQVCIGFFVKHLVSLLDIVDETAEGNFAKLTRPILDEKIGDAINYLILLEAIFVQVAESQK